MEALGSLLVEKTTRILIEAIPKLKGKKGQKLNGFGLGTSFLALRAKKWILCC